VIDHRKDARPAGKPDVFVLERDSPFIPQVKICAKPVMLSEMTPEHATKNGRDRQFKDNLLDNKTSKTMMAS